ncbi:hypothetical protein [Actinocrispum sp. NPDC049592]|uniref:hypothetical protein n=1 Tax=Actinocrispum sp. NPDC049592 TaxID=3154835 RepID=UPI003433A879
MTGYQADPVEMAAAAARLADSADEVRAAAAALGEGVRGDLGPGGITAAADQLISVWAARMRAASTDLAAAGQDIRTSGDLYAGAEEVAAAGLRLDLP